MTFVASDPDFKVTNFSTLTPLRRSGIIIIIIIINVLIKVTLNEGTLQSQWSKLTDRYDTCYQGISQFYLHTHTFIRNRNAPYLPLLRSLHQVSYYSFSHPSEGKSLSRPV